MFNFLKEKLTSWKEKIKEEFTEKELAAPKSEKKTKKDKKTTKKVKETKKEKPTKEKSSKKVEKEPKISKSSEEIIEPTEKLQEEVKKNGFFSKLFSKKESDNKTAELVIEDVQKEGTKIESPEARYEIEQSQPAEKVEEHKGFFDKFKKKITEEKFEELFTELEMAMLQNNVAYEAVQQIKRKLSSELIGKNLSEVSLEEKLKEAISDILINPPNFIKQVKEGVKNKKPYVIVFVGINGSGKTTSIAKVAHLLKKEKLSVCLGAADTFRAAAIEQLEIHANKIGIPIIKKDYGSDPASVGFETIAYAKKHAIDVVLLDTAGRMNTKESLMKEMEKIIKVSNPDLKIFLGESITGNDATEQAKSFNEHISIDGIILSKADVDEKGGTALSVSYITKKPIYFLGTGQAYEDLEVFDKDKVIKNLGL
ncbi:signal recognition particle-docking protein FtsY [Candidatus Pacearchaeota archaeon]|nr:signal recognition particle-docking protein FtsY [Candidatus Pacearchaeota archaeon]